MKQIIYVPFDQLHRDYGGLKNAEIQNDVIAFVESTGMTAGRACPLEWYKYIDS